MSIKHVYAFFLGSSLIFSHSACGDDGGQDGDDTDTDTEDDDITGDDNAEDDSGSEGGSGSDGGSGGASDSGADTGSDGGDSDEGDGSSESEGGSDSGGDDWPDDMYEECLSNDDCDSGICFISTLTSGSFCSAACEEGGTPCPPGGSGTATPSCENSSSHGLICALLCDEGELDSQGSCPNTMCCENINQPACTHPVDTCGGGGSTEDGGSSDSGGTDDSGGSSDSGSDTGTDDSGSSDDSGDTDTDTTTIAG